MVKVIKPKEQKNIPIYYCAISVMIVTEVREATLSPVFWKQQIDKVLVTNLALIPMLNYIGAFLFIC